MAQAQGSQVKIILGEEGTFKAVPSAGIELPFTGESIKLSRNIFESKTLSGNRNPRVPQRGNYDVTGDISVEVSPQKVFCILLKHALGSSAVSGEASPYTHTFKIGDLPTGLTLEKQFTDLASAKYFQNSGIKINTFKMGVNPEGLVEASFGMIGCKETIASSSFDSSPEATILTPFDAFSAVIKEGGSTIATVTSFEFTLDNGLDGGIYTIGGAGERASLPEGLATLKGSIKALFDDVALYTKAINHTESSLEVSLSLGTGAGTAGNENITIYIDELRYQPNAPVVSGPGGILVDLPFIAYLGDDADASALRVVVMNSLSSIAIT